MTLPDHYSQGTTETSREAHASVNRQTQRYAVLAWWGEQCDGATLREAADAIQWKGHQISYGALSARFEELRAEGHLRRRRFRPPLMGEQRKNPSGRMAYIYEAVNGGRAIAVAAAEYQRQITLERGQLCPTCRGRGYIRSDVAQHDPDTAGAAIQPELW